MRRRGPGEPETADGQQDGADDHRPQSVLGDHLAVVLEAAPHARLRHVVDVGRAGDDADADGDEGQRAHAEAVAALAVEADRVGLEEEVDEAVDEAGVQRHQEQDGLPHQHEERPPQILDHNGPPVDGRLVQLGVDSPVPRLVADLARLAL